MYASSTSGTPAKVQKINEPNWRKSASNFNGLLKTMYLKNISIDLILHVDGGKASREIGCHALVLKAQSPVFESLLNAPWMNQEEPNSIRTLTLKDDPIHVGVFVGLLYEDWKEEDFCSYEISQISLIYQPEVIVRIFALAHKYVAHQLYILLRRLPVCQTNERAVKILLTVEKCLLGDGGNVLSHPFLLHFEKSDLARIVQHEDLQCPEKLIYMGCLEWAVSECRKKGMNPIGKNLRIVLGEILHFIRFPLIDNVTLTDEIIPLQLLTSEEATELMLFKLNKDCHLLKKKRSVFPVNARTSPNTLRLNRWDPEKVAKHLVDFSSPHGFKMAVSEDIKLSSICLFGGHGDNIIFNVEIIRSQDVIHSLTSESTGMGHFINAKIDPVLVIPKLTEVTIRFKVKGGNLYSVKEEITEETKEICVWNKKAIIFTFKRCIGLRNGLNQIPVLEFSI